MTDQKVGGESDKQEVERQREKVRREKESLEKDGASFAQHFSSDSCIPFASWFLFRTNSYSVIVRREEGGKERGLEQTIPKFITEALETSDNTGNIV